VGALGLEGELGGVTLAADGGSRVVGRGYGGEE
jgi:hypothetical protein